ncbi:MULTISPECIES: acyl-CoA dehydrogenase [Streptomyces]|uniref:Acyl-CoA dehydrogenase n=1 Tax=Streptomyces diastaticus subsp. diastaticus TaxID=68040 RepID=A0ABQ1CQI8_STRDI|nr:MULTISPECIES: acyl-CoA dehydrogenase [Streptomyces]PJM81569.1 acyl-CoA dehydrogenase [Streptomyces sp. TSRI0384-2]RPK82639.1 Acyl-CoA dehydrogenase [Streptomyces sp. ADI98-12]GFH72631.1 acyl-CoA dehydrogenase [Streptomyces diastaticus subsp. diastaticus]GGU23686.1 acyl-CoA dehydrogenase [Streptomyces diastaticus subsp. diastaticus]
MTIGLTQEHRDLRDAVRAFATRHITEDVLRAAADAGKETLPEYFGGLAEQGLLGLHLPEEAGGAGYGLVELAVVTEELGRAMAPGPFLPTTLASAVLHAGGHRTHLAALAAGASVGALGLAPGTLALTRAADGTATLTGTSELVVGGHLADVFVLPAADGGRTTWVALPRAAVDTTDLRSHDLTRRSSRVTARSVPVPAADLLDLAPERPRDLAATLFAAEASGIADRCVTTAAGYARVREQFGRPVGQFQGVKHRCARMLAHAEQARACAWDAARAGEPGDAGPEEAALAAAVAGAVSVEAAFVTAKDCIQVLGGIGFTWEHDAHLALRRAQTLRSTLGPTAAWRRRVARLALDGSRRTLGVELPPEAETVRESIRAELRTAAALDGAERRIHLADRGYTAPHLPAPWGKGADPVTQLVIAEELRAARLTPVDMVIGGWVVPTIIAHGDDAQRERFLAPSLRGDLRWCQLFSEPGAGSDLAALTTRAEKVDGGWRITGQKVWTSMARDAHWGVLLARTDTDVPKHQGISYFLLDMTSPGLDIRPLRQITGDAEFNEVFLDDVFVPDDLLVGEPGAGWKLARTTLANERVALSTDSVGSGAETLLEMAAASHGPDDERLTTLGGHVCDAQSGALLGLRTTLRTVSGQQPGAEASIAKLLGVEHQQRVWETCADWEGTAALTGEGPHQDTMWMFLNSRCMSIAGGTTEVQLNIIGERLLGLPRDPEPTPRKG